MARSRFRVSLRIWHPCIDPQIITAALRIPPSRSWKAGEPRTTPKGNPLKGNNKDTYWSAEMCRGDDPPYKLVAEIDRLLDKLAVHGDFLRQIRAEGGGSEFFVGWFLRSMAGATFSQPVLTKMTELGIDLALDTYYDPDVPEDNDK
jgi:hypothetical protein